jgi:hypothetical protein
MHAHLKYQYHLYSTFDLINRYCIIAVVKSNNSYFQRFCQTIFDQGQFDLLAL